MSAQDTADTDVGERAGSAESGGEPARRILIDGQLVAMQQTFATINPASGKVLGHAPDAGEKEARQAIAAARRAGSFSVNGGNYFGADSPFGGCTQSGVGSEMGVAGLQEFPGRKTLALPAIGAGA